MKDVDIVVIGAGPAGVSASIQLKRSGHEPLLIEKGEVGGIVRNAQRIENYPGFPEGIGGAALADRFERQLQSAGVEINAEEVIRLERAGDSFHITTDKRDIKARTVVIATGTVPKTIPELRISEEAAPRIFYEVRGLFDVREKKMVIIGAGDAAFDYALSMSGGNDVLMLNRSGATRCLQLLRERCMKEPSITYMDNVRVDAVECEGENIVLHCASAGDADKKDIEADYLLIAVGREPRLDYVDTKLKEDMGALTSSKALYLVGDVKNETFRQTAICVGDGVRAAMEICRYGTMEKL